MNDGSISFGPRDLPIILGYITNAVSFGDMVTHALRTGVMNGYPQTQHDIADLVIRSINAGERKAHVTEAGCVLAERENDNLRRLLSWAGRRLEIKDRQRLAGMLRKSLDEGGVVGCAAEDAEEELEEMRRLVVKMGAHLRKMIDHLEGSGGSLSGIAEDLASKAAEFEEPRQAETWNLRSLREFA